MTSFKEELKKKFKSKELSSDQLQTLISAQEQKTKFNKKFYSILAIAACAILIMINAFTFNISSKVASEIAYNHLKDMPSEIITNDYNLINKKLDKLSFNIKTSQRFAHYKTLGARYCSIQGKTAAQIKIISETGKIFTLYQYELDSNFDEPELSLTEDNVLIKLWKEGNIHFGLAESI